MFISACILILLIMMNMLIAVMALPFGDIARNKQKYLNKFKVEMILDFQDHVDVQKEFKESKYILTVCPEESTVQTLLGDHLTLFDINRQL